MNRAQRIILIIGLVAIAMAGVFPPWTANVTGHPYGLGYRFILHPPTTADVRIAPRDRGFGGAILTIAAVPIQIDTTKLAIEWIVIAALFGIGMAVAGWRPVPPYDPGPIGAWNYPKMTDHELTGQAGVAGGMHIESMRRLRVAVEKLDRTTTVLTWVIIVLTAVGIVIALVKG